jgi:hypothetical protein
MFPQLMDKLSQEPGNEQLMADAIASFEELNSCLELAMQVCGKTPTCPQFLRATAALQNQRTPFLFHVAKYVRMLVFVPAACVNGSLKLPLCVLQVSQLVGAQSDDMELSSHNNNLSHLHSICVLNPAAQLH